MGSEPDLATIRDAEVSPVQSSPTDGSVLSLSSNSTYFTAKDGTGSTTTSQYFTPDDGSGSKGSGGSGDSSSRASTMGSPTLEGSSSSLKSSVADYGAEVDGERSRSRSLSPSENSIEVREDISRICSTLAESQAFAWEGKKREIELALKKRDLPGLRKLAMGDGGLLSNSLRTTAWPLLLNVSWSDISKNECKKIPTFYPDVPEKISQLVSLDVARVLKRFPPGLTDPQQDHLQLYLNNLICSVLQENRETYYYQGFHDISLTFLLVAISQSVPYLSYLCLDKMVKTNLEPYMEKTMDKTHDVIHVLFAILEMEDKELFKKIVVGCKCPVAFCLPWVLTWFSHTLPSDTDVFRLYDFVLGAQEMLKYKYLIPIFVSATLLIREASQIKSDDELTDIASMHHRLAKLPSELDSLEPWLEDSVKLMQKYRGREDNLIGRGVEIKAFQHRLWNEDNNNRPIRPLPRPPGIISSVGRFFFVRHRWTTMSIVILGTAYLLQLKYGRSVYQITTIKSMLKSYAPERFQNIINYWLVDETTDE